MGETEHRRGYAVFLEAGQLAERTRVAIRKEGRIVAESGSAARRPDQRSVGPGFDLLDMAVGPGHAQRRDEMRPSLVRRGGAALLQRALDPRHGGGKILALAGPARGIDTGRAIERIDDEPGIVGKG